MKTKMRTTIVRDGYKFLFLCTKTIAKNLGIPKSEVVLYNRINEIVYVPREEVINEVGKIASKKSDVRVLTSEIQRDLMCDAVDFIIQRYAQQ